MSAEDDYDHPSQPLGFRRAMKHPDARRAKQMSVNVHWLIEQMDLVHDALCPELSGTWTQRAEQCVVAARALTKKDKA